MSISLGSTNFGSLYLGSTKIGEAYLGNVKVYGSTPVDPLNPLGLPPYTIRLRFNNGVTPSFSKGTAVQVSSDPNVYDLTYENTNWYSLLSDQTALVAVLGANTSGVTQMESIFAGCSNMSDVPLFDTSSVTTFRSMFYSCRNITSAPLFDTSSATSMERMFGNSTVQTIPLYDTSSVTQMRDMFMQSSIRNIPILNTANVTDMSQMFSGCTLLTTVPLLDTSSVTNMNTMFYNCVSVQSGALALYQQASTQAVPPASHVSTFQDCGRSTTTGSAELAQIPESWGGMMY